MEINLRSEIEKLAIWYIPVAFITTTIASLYAIDIKQAMITGEILPGAYMALASAFPASLKLAINIVVAIWLYSQTKASNRKYLWFLFGLIANLIAALIYIAVLIYEQNASNKSLNTGRS